MVFRRRQPRPIEELLNHFRAVEVDFRLVVERFLATAIIWEYARSDRRLVDNFHTWHQQILLSHSRNPLLAEWVGLTMWEVIEKDQKKPLPARIESALVKSALAGPLRWALAGPLRAALAPGWRFSLDSVAVGVWNISPLFPQPFARLDTGKITPIDGITELTARWPGLRMANLHSKPPPVVCKHPICRRGNAKSVPWFLLKELSAYRFAQAGFSFREAELLLKWLLARAPIPSAPPVLPLYDKGGWSDAVKHTCHRLRIMRFGLHMIGRSQADIRD